MSLRWRSVMAGVSLVAGLVAIGTQASPASADATFNQRMLALINQSRAANGIPALLWDQALGTVAENGPYSGCGFSVQGRAYDMGVRNYFSHTIPNCGGKSLFDMLGAAAISHTGAAENIAYTTGTTDPLAAADAFHSSLMNSSGHRANILNPNYTHVGVGSWRTSPGQAWSGGGAPFTNVWVAAEVFARGAVVTSPPVAPPWASATAGNGQVTVDWGLIEPVAGSGIDSYAAFLFTSAGFSGLYAVVCGTCTRATITGAANGTAYVAVVAAHNAVDWGAGTITQWVTPGTPGSSPMVRATPADDTVYVSWSPAPANGSTIDMYFVAAFTSAEFSGQYAIVCPTCTSTTVTGLTGGTSYLLAVYAHSTWGWGPPAVSQWVSPS